MNHPGTADTRPRVQLMATMQSLIGQGIAMIAVLRGWLDKLNVRRTTPRQLRVDEFASLGEKRFVAVVEFEDERFLIGGANSSVNLLARLNSRSSSGTDFTRALNACLEEGK